MNRGEGKGLKVNGGKFGDTALPEFPIPLFVSSQIITPALYLSRLWEHNRRRG